MDKATHSDQEESADGGKCY